MTESVVLGENGRIVIPASVRRELGLKTGDRLTLISSDQGIRLVSMKMAIDEVRKSIVAERGSLKGILEEFLEERHEEARRERADRE